MKGRGKERGLTPREVADMIQSVYQHQMHID